MKRISVYMFIGLILFNAACNKTATNPGTHNPFLLFPAGRSFISGSDVWMLINGAPVSPEVIDDHCGGFWYKANLLKSQNSETILVRYTRKKGTLQLFHEVDVDTTQWLAEVYYIDCLNDSIVWKAAELTTGCTTRLEKARQIHQFMVHNISLKLDYHDSFLDKASRTLTLGYGTCMNFSRLYVALCRAAHVPARTVWGIVYSHQNEPVYDYHHQWAETLDDEGYWHPMDFNYTTFFDLNDIRYLDLLYAPEDNPLLLNRESTPVELGNITYFYDYPITLTGRLGFELVEDARPDSMVIQYSYRYSIK